MQTEFNIEWGEGIQEFYCYVEGEFRCSPFVDDLLNDISSLYGYTYVKQISESHYKLMLEQELGIKINFNFDY
jgi:hypothetical protein